MRILKTTSVLRPAQTGVAPPVRRAWVQSKLRVGQPDDQYEREADRIADDVAAAGQLPPALSRHDFGRIRIHADEHAAEAAAALDARAFTFGSDIYFGAGEYAPETEPSQRLLAHELTHVVQQQARGRILQRVPSPAAEGAVLTGEANPAWQFQRTTEGTGLRMNPAFWVVTYYHQPASGGESAFTNTERQTALQVFRQFCDRDRACRAAAVRGEPVISRTEIALRADVAASAAARDLTSRDSARHYAFECFTAAALLQFVGVWRGLQQTSPATADAAFDRTHADFSVTRRGPQALLHMGGVDIGSNLPQLGSFTLRELLADPADRGLQRGDWVFLNNGRFITSGAFQGENATYLGNKRFHGHGIGVFDIDQYVARLRRDHRVRLSRDEILNQVTVAPHYRAPETTAGRTGGVP